MVKDIYADSIEDEIGRSEIDDATTAVKTVDPEELSRATDNKDSNDKTGSLSNPVGTGKHARTNIIWYIVSATFVIFSCIASAMIVMDIYGFNTKGLSENIKDMWGMFTPVITLSLGYLFGKQGKKKKRKRKQTPRRRDYFLSE